MLPWRTRRVVPSVMDQVDRNLLDRVRRADDDVKRMAAAHDRTDQ
jgi:hypothetical protein